MIFQLNFAVGIINFLYFSLRALATDNFLKFMWEMETIVDMLTLPPLFMSIWLERTWLGLRFFRFLIWFNFPDILVYLRVLSNSSSIRLAQVDFLYKETTKKSIYILACFIYYWGTHLVRRTNISPWKLRGSLARVYTWK